jgi:Flp pilus assembly protein TadD
MAAAGLPRPDAATDAVPGRAPAATMVSALALCCVLAGCASPSAQRDAAGAGSADPYERAMRMADTIRRGGDLTTAAGLYEQAHALAPGRPEPLVAIGEISAALGSPERASAAFARALELAPDDGDVRRGYGKVLLVLNSPPTATDQFRAAIRLDPGDARAYNGLGVTLDLMGRHDEAQRAYRDGLAQRPNDVALTNNLALSLAMAGRADEGRALLQSIAAVPDAGPRVRQNLALVHALSGDMAAAADIARQDLSEAEVHSYLAFYKGLGGLNGRALAEAVFRAQLGRDKASGPTPTKEPPSAPEDAYPEGAGQARARTERSAAQRPALADASESRFQRLTAAVDAVQTRHAGDDPDGAQVPEVCEMTEPPSPADIVGRGREARSPLEIVIETPARGRQRPGRERSLPSIARASLASAAATVGDQAAVVGRGLRAIVTTALRTIADEASIETEVAAVGPMTIRLDAAPATTAARAVSTPQVPAGSWPKIP